MKFHEYPNAYVQSVTLRVNNLQKMITFYESIIGLKVIDGSETMATLSADGKTPLLYLELLTDVEPKTRRTTGLYHFALLVPTREDLGDVLHHLITSGYPIQGASDHNVSEAIYLADPEGNGIEIYRDRSSSEWEWNGDFVKMDTLQMDAQGVLDAGNNKEWNGIASETIMGHIHLHVADLDRTVHFYVEVLGFDIVQKYGVQAFFLSTGHYHHHIGLNIWNGVGIPAPKETNTGLKFYNVKLPSTKVYDEIVETLKEKGIEYNESETYALVKDPSGNTIRLTY